MRQVLRSATIITKCDNTHVEVQTLGKKPVDLKAEAVVDMPEHPAEVHYETFGDKFGCRCRDNFRQLATHWVMTRPRHKS